MQFDFTQEFDRLGMVIIKDLHFSVRDQIGLDGQPYSPPAASTLRKRASEDIDSTERMYVTGDYAKEAFNYLANPLSLRVFVNDTQHISGKSFKQLTAWNSRGQT